jgi:hypothetical protein
VQESAFAFLVVIPEGDLLLFSCLSFRSEAEESAVHPCRRHASHRHSDRSEAKWRNLLFVWTANNASCR